MAFCTFSNNFAWSVGGAVYVEESIGGTGSASSVIMQCAFGGNVAGQAGALYLLNAGPWSISKSQYTGNRALVGLNATSADIMGGAVCVDTPNSGPIAISECSFSDNFCDSWGGGVAILDGDVSCEKSRFERNHSGGAGGALYVIDKAEVAISRCSILGNASPLTGSAIHFDGALGVPPEK